MTFGASPPSPAAFPFLVPGHQQRSASIAQEQAAVQEQPYSATADQALPATAAGIAPDEESSSTELSGRMRMLKSLMGLRST